MGSEDLNPNTSQKAKERLRISEQVADPTDANIVGNIIPGSSPEQGEDEDVQGPQDEQRVSNRFRRMIASRQKATQAVAAAKKAEGALKIAKWFFGPKKYIIIAIAIIIVLILIMFTVFMIISIVSQQL